MAIPSIPPSNTLKQQQRNIQAKGIFKQLAPSYHKEQADCLGMFRGSLPLTANLLASEVFRDVKQATK